MPTDDLVVVVDGTSTDERQLGGKGAWLGRLRAHGFAVPPTAVLTTAAYRTIATRPELAHRIAAWQESATPASPTAEQAAVDAAFAEVELPAAVRAAIRAAYDSVADPAEPRVAVRSSATAEDLHGTSFAGQYRSIVPVGADDLERAVRLVWASLWHPAPRAYRWFHGVDDPDLGMAVVIMRLVDADHAGVAFTIDPTTAADPTSDTGGDSVRVETVSGLGEQLVSGQVTPTVTRVPRAAATASRAGDADLATRVAGLALAVEDALGTPQDLEWAEVHDELFVLQARPITTSAAEPAAAHDGADSPVSPGTRWTTAGIAEMLPGVLAPLVWDCSHLAIEEAFRRLFDSTGVLPADVDDRGGFVARIRGQAALNLDLVEAIAEATPGGSAAEVERQYFGRAAGESPRTTGGHRRRWSGAIHDLRAARARPHSAAEAATVRVAATDLATLAPEVTDLADDELLAYRARLLDLGGRAMAAEVAVAATAVATYRRLEAQLAKHLDDREVARRAQLLSRRAMPPPAVAGTPATSSRAVYTGATASERTDAPVPSAPAGPAAGRDTAVGVAEAWTELVARLEAEPDPTGLRSLTSWAFDLRLVNLRRLVEDAAVLLARREATKAALLAVGGEIRRVHLEHGRRLVEAGRLEEAADVDLLRDRELVGAAPFPPPAELARRRRWLIVQQAAGPLPERFRGRPTTPSAPLPTGTVLHGWGAGPGRCTAPAQVLTGPDDRPLERGAVLVARTTDASWSPVLARAGAIVVERGGPLSHAAIVARELGIPAVLNVPGAIERLAGGDHTVTVDGDEGLVVVEDGATS